VAEHLSRKELKQDKIHDAIEQGAEAVYSHGQLAAILVTIAIAAVLIYGGWKFYNDRQTVLASAALDEAMKTYNAPIRQANVPVEPGELTFNDNQTRAQEASQKFAAVADKYSSTNPGKLARYYEGLARAGKTDEAIKMYRAVAEQKSVLVPRPLVLLELADLLRQTKPGEATTMYQQIKKDYPGSPISERADRGLDMLAPKS